MKRRSVQSLTWSGCVICGHFERSVCDTLNCAESHGQAVIVSQVFDSRPSFVFFSLGLRTLRKLDLFPHNAVLSRVSITGRQRRSFRFSNAHPAQQWDS